MKNNVFDTVLILEGGGMKASYTAGIVNTLLAHEIYFDNVEGTSAGSSHLVNYLSRDMRRTKMSFVDIVKVPGFASRKSFVKGKGYFNGDYIYYELAKKTNELPYIYKGFMANPAKIRIPTFDAKTGNTKIWTRNDIRDTESLMTCVKSSSSLPYLMGPTKIGDGEYYDGGLSEDDGFLLNYLMDLGFKKFFFILTYPKGHRATKQKGMWAMNMIGKNQPILMDKIENRYKVYNDVMDKIDELEEKGMAYAVRPDHYVCKINENRIEVLEENYKEGREKGERDVEKRKAFLNLK